MSSDFDSGDAEPAIHAANTLFSKNARAGNVDRLVDDFYAVDATMMPPGFPAIHGRDSIRKLMAGLVGSGLDVTLTTDDVIQSGDLAAETGHYSMAGAHPGSGKYVVVWRKIDGRWQAVDDIFNDDAPAH